MRFKAVFQLIDVLRVAIRTGKAVLQLIVGFWSKSIAAEGALRLFPGL